MRPHRSASMAAAQPPSSTSSSQHVRTPSQEALLQLIAATLQQQQHPLSSQTPSLPTMSLSHLCRNHLSNSSKLTHNTLTLIELTKYEPRTTIISHSPTIPALIILVSVSSPSPNCKLRALQKTKFPLLLLLLLLHSLHQVLKNQSFLSLVCRSRQRI